MSSSASLAAAEPAYAAAWAQAVLPPAVVACASTPTCGGFYMDYPGGPRWETLLADELPRRLAGQYSLMGKDSLAGKAALIGFSMGGYGALLLARESHRKSLKDTDVAAAAAGSPALFTSYKSSAAGAFDDATDFARYGDLSDNPDVGSTPLHVACGRDDSFTEATKRYRSSVSPTPAGDIDKGCHTEGYWRSLATRQLAFLGDHLA